MSTYIIAEMACSHDGQMDLARTIIDAAGSAGADAIQFQIWNLRAKLVPQHPDFEKESKIELSPDQWAELADYVRENHPQMDIIACVYERSSVDVAMKIGAAAFKIHTADLSNPHLIRYVAETQKRIDLSVGGSTLDEIAAAVNWIREAGNEQIWMMYGIQNFPTPTSDLHLRYMRKLRDLFELPLGYQDHSDPESPDSFYVPACAQGLGVDIQEKHITHDRSKKGIDHEAALNPDEFAEFCRMVRMLDAALGIPVPKPFTDEEIKYRKYAKKSIVAARDLSAGETIGDDDVRFMRAEELGFPPDESRKVIGRTLQRDLGAYRVIHEEDLA